MTAGVYTVDEHNHRFAAWAAGRAASTSTQRFPVETGRKLLEACGFAASMGSPEDLPDPTVIDHAHAQWRATMKAAAATAAPAFVLTDGIAAKLINCYLKARFVCGGFAHHPRSAALHPPIDRLLLAELSRNNFADRASDWRMARNLGWSNFDSLQYQAVINAIRDGMGGQPMWMIEKFWQGHQ